MDEADFTTKERFSIDLQRDPARLFRSSLIRTLCYVVPSATLVVYGAFREDFRFVLLGYAVLLGHQIGRLVLLARGVRTQRNILAKYEARLRRTEPATSPPSPPPEAPPAP